MGQDGDGYIVLKASNEPLASVFKQLEQQTVYKVMYVTEDVKDCQATLDIRTKDIEEAMSSIIAQHPLEFSISDQFITVTRQGRGSKGSRHVSGVVVDETGEPLMGATIVIAGSKKGVTTDLEGKFAIEVPAGRKISISYLGMETQTLAPKATMHITMSENTMLHEVVVTGMQKVDKRLFTGSSTKIGADDAKWDGWKGYVTNTVIEAKEVVTQYHGLWVVEKAFRVTKGNLEARPVFHFTSRRIEAHICICFIAYKVYNFDEAPLVEVVTELGRWYNIDVIIENRELMERHVRFFFPRNEPIDRAVELLNTFHEFHAVIQDGQLIIKDL